VTRDLDYIARHGHRPAPGRQRPCRPSRNGAYRQCRIAREAEMIAEARASAAAGRMVSSEEVDAWIDSLDTNHELPAPRSGR
jgi:predicted transcriptional regulator